MANEKLRFERQVIEITEKEFEMSFRPFIKLKILICKNDKCLNNFILTDEEILKLIRKTNGTYELEDHGIVTVTCPMCKTVQTVNSADLIGDYGDFTKKTR